MKLLQGQLVELGIPFRGADHGEIGVCVHIDGHRYGLLFRNEFYDEFTVDHLKDFMVQPLRFVDEEARHYQFTSVIRLIDEYRRGHFVMFRTALFPNGVPYAED